MSLVISKVFTYDTDAGDYIQRVEGASGDNQALEPATRQAINNFVIGCKQDGIWNAIKASCILSGARTLNGALQPLVGTAPTNFNFVSGDYNRKTGLVGNGSTKYLDSNRNNNADPQNSNHNALYITNMGGGTEVYMGSDPPTGSTGANNIGTAGIVFFRSRCASNGGKSGVTAPTLLGTARSAFGSYLFRSNGVYNTQSTNSETPFNGNMTIFASGGTGYRTTARLAFYSIGESLDLALLDARVTALITAFGVAIP